MIRGLSFSLALHVLILMLAILGLPHIRRDLEKQDYAFVVDIVNVSDLNNIKVTPKKQEKKAETVPATEVKDKVQEAKEDSKNNNPNVSKKQAEAPKASAPQAEKQEVENKVAPPKPQKPTVTEQPQKKPDERDTKTKKQSEDDAINLARDKKAIVAADRDNKKDDAKNDDKKVADKKDNAPEKKVDDKKSTDITKKKAEEKKKKQDDEFANSILKSLKEGGKGGKKDKDNAKDKEKKDISTIMDDAVQGETNTDYNPDLPMSISEISAIRSQIERAWNASAFSGGDENLSMKVTLRVGLDKDGNVLSVRPVSQSGSGSTYRAFVDSAVRAVHDASPLKNLPADKYHSWQEIELSFDSNGMIY